MKAYMKRLFLIVVVILAALMPLACSQTYTFSPVAASTPTPTAVVTPSCSVSAWGNYQSVTCVGGITWGNGAVMNYDNNSVNQYAATLALAVNCSPETTDVVTMTGPGVTLPLAYVNNITLGATNYALYQSSTITGSLSAGSTYTLTSVTSIGTATASLPLSQPLSITGSSPLTVSWDGTNCCGLGLFQVYSGVQLYTSGLGFIACSPILISGGSICTSPCEMGAELISYTSTITGGAGNYSVYNGEIVTVP
jgi:hypothetical protein